MTVIGAKVADDKMPVVDVHCTRYGENCQSDYKICLSASERY